MVARLIDGKAIASGIREDLKVEIEALHAKGVKPCLAVILVGEDPASQIYVNMKVQTCQALGILSQKIELPVTTSEEALLLRIEALNNDDAVHGILVQLPLPAHIDKQKVVETILPTKDVDGFHPENVGRIVSKQRAFVPCTPFGIVRMLKKMNLPIAGKHAVILGRSDIVGKPVGQLLLNENATVTYCHSQSQHIDEIVRMADIVVVAIGVAKFLQASWLSPGAVVIDVGINRLEDGSLCGDVDFDQVKDVAGFVTPVPGGVGPMTIAMLMHNTVKAASISSGILGK